MRRYRLTLLTVALVCVLPAAGLEAAPRVDMELITEARVSPLGPQQWAKLLAELGVGSVRIGSARRGARAGIENIGTETRPAFKVTGVLSAQNVLLLPGARFRLTDRTQLARWLADLGKLDGPGGEKTNSFGITNAQFQTVHKDLATPVNFSTRGVATITVANRISRLLKLKLVVDAAARKALDPRLTVRDELQGMSCGTALAVVLRPAGLILRPQPGGTAADQVAHHVEVARPDSNPWPIGWPPPERKKPSDVAPALFKFFEIAAEEEPLENVLALIESTVKVPLVYDQNSMALRRIDVAQVKVTLDADRAYAVKILSRALGQARLKHELRLDENGKPFVWITPFGGGQ